MKIKFEELKYQEQAVKSVTNLFKKENEWEEYEANNYKVRSVGLINIETNKISYSDELIKRNLEKIQSENNIPISTYKTNFENKNKFEVEMETGTGKTFVFLKTIFELNKLYGLKKFVILAPSIAIKEGIRKTIEQTKEHFFHQYGKRMDAFVWSSDNPNDLLHFAKESGAKEINVMIATIQGFKNPNTNIIHKPSETFQGEKPINVLKFTRPVLIIDEPQKTTSSNLSKQIIDEYIQPLFTLSYSATHKEIHNLVYRLSAFDAYEQNLVKKIGIRTPVDYKTQNQLVEVIDIISTSTSIKAKLRIRVKDDNSKDGFDYKLIEVYDDPSNKEDLFVRSNYNYEYQNCFVVEKIINDKDNNLRYVQFSNGKTYSLGEKVVDDRLKKIMIKSLIEKHLKKESKLNKKGIKVLSLFFIDEVAKYREYDGNQSYEGQYAKWFEECYWEVVTEPNFDKIYPNIQPEYKVNDFNQIKKFHGGYFAQDKGKYINTTDSETDNKKYNEKAYDLILKDKEKLLSFNSSLRFIFSHSALKEGWDNPNVFNICVLKDGSKNVITKRQEIGRGLRLCVDQNGERIKEDGVNELTIVSSESYSEFAESLQKEFKDVNGGQVQIRTNINIFNDLVRNSIFKELSNLGYISNGNTTKKLIDAFNKKENPIDLNKLGLNQVFSHDDIIKFNNELRRQIQSSQNIKITNDNSNNKKVELNVDDDKKKLIIKVIETLNKKHFYTYSLDSELLIKQAIKKLQELCKEVIDEESKIQIRESKLQNYGLVNIEVEHDKTKWHKVDLDSNIDTNIFSNRQKIEFMNFYNEEIIKFIAKKTLLTFKTIDTIIQESGTLNLMYINKIMYKKLCYKAISQVWERQKSKNLKYEFDFSKDNVEWDKLTSSLFDLEISPEEYERFEKLRKNNFKNSLLDAYKLDSKNEIDFLEVLINLENNNIDVFTKLPNLKTKVPTGTYSPDWLIIKNSNKGLVLETKAGFGKDNIKETEKQKIFYFTRFIDNLTDYIHKNKDKLNIEENLLVIFDALKSDGKQLDDVLNQDRNLVNFKKQLEKADNLTRDDEYYWDNVIDKYEIYKDELKDNNEN